MVSATLFVLHINLNLGFKSHFAPGGSPLTRRWAFAPGENQRFAWVRAKSIQERPGAARTAQEQPMDALEASGATRSSQRQPRNQPRTLRNSQRQLRSSQEQPADSQEPPGAARSSQEHPGATRAGFRVPGGSYPRGDSAEPRSQGLTL